MQGSNHDVAVDDMDGLCELAVRIGADLVIIGPEAPLVAGLADRLRHLGSVVLVRTRRVHYWKDQATCEEHHE